MKDILQKTTKSNGHQIVNVVVKNGKEVIKAVDNIVPITLLPYKIILAELDKIRTLEIDFYSKPIYKYYLVGFIWSQLGEKGRTHYHNICESFPDYNIDETDTFFTQCKGLISNNMTAGFILHLNSEIAKLTNQKI